MALINCPECGKEISDRVKVCPHCGYPFMEEQSEVSKVELSGVNLIKDDTPERKAKRKKIILYSLIGAVIVIVLSLVGAKVSKTLEKKKIYNDGVLLIEEKRYLEAKELFNNISDYKDASEQAINADIQAEIEYATKFSETAAQIKLQTLLIQVRCYLISEEWRNAIDSKRDKDFNEEIQKLLRKWEDSGSTQEMKDLKNEIDSQMKNLKNPVGGYEDPYEFVLEMYGIYIQLYEQSISPSGSLLTYNKDINLKSSEFEKVYNQITVILPEIIEEYEQIEDNLDVEGLVN